MLRTATLSVEVPAPAADVAARVSDLAQLESLHPLIRSIRLESEVDGLRRWRCEDRIFGFKLVYFAEQRIDAGGLTWKSTVRQGGLLLTNAWSVTALASGGSRIDETMTFEGPAPIVWFSVSVGVKAHRGLFAAIGRSFRAGAGGSEPAREGVVQRDGRG